MAMNPHQHHHQTLTPYEQRLRDEVLYLHSLWHRGPPTLNPKPNFLRSTRYSSYSNNNPSRNLHVSNSISFKKIRGNKHRNQTAKNLTISISDPLPDPGPEWPVNPPASSPPPTWSPAWPSFKEKSSPSTRTVPDIDEAKFAAMQMQHKVVKSCNRFFAKRVDLGSEEDDEFDEEGEEDDSFSDDSEIEESKEFKFFLNLFVENRELRNFYENNSQETGEFYCLVCAGIRVKLGKIFKGCLGLVQHAITILNTKRKRAHRAFGLVICRVLGWDISRLPVIVLKGEPLSQSLANLGEALNCLKEDDAKEVIEDFDNGVSGMDTSQRGGMDYELGSAWGG
ncbi:hypothetical protein JCGZ_10565 [Jatropha curcas]|uniref:Uncharacterized protein n=1 Tax=Jatropha curcas TaxID=180498 RepID=A0A067KR90_JATCU|nr:hypothetical protein JCGZ_10565 [Jatropha curcas]